MMENKEPLTIPFCEGLETQSFEHLKNILEREGADCRIDTLNWSADWPYRPDVTLYIARSTSHLVLMYNVEGLDLRAEALEDNGNVWEDSCCEFFVSDPYDGTYYNFELNCIGTLLASKRRSREDAVMFTRQQLDKVVRHSTLPHKRLEETGLRKWSVAMCIPFTLFGVDPQNLPKTLKVNFYKCADKATHPHFLSWNPIPVPKPDFHRPEYFGTIIL
ncbi:MAG: carbohydrate-binding family 9-like protein [Candidatus Cryptobacteroides sp.]